MASFVLGADMQHLQPENIRTKLSEALRGRRERHRCVHLCACVVWGPVSAWFKGKRVLLCYRIFTSILPFYQCILIGGYWRMIRLKRPAVQSHAELWIQKCQKSTAGGSLAGGLLAGPLRGELHFGFTSRTKRKPITWGPLSLKHVSCTIGAFKLFKAGLSIVNLFEVCQGKCPIELL